MLKHKLLLIHAPCHNVMMLFLRKKGVTLMIIESFIKINDPRIHRTNTTGTVHVNKVQFITFLYIIKMTTKTAQSVQSANCLT